MSQFLKVFFISLAITGILLAGYLIIKPSSSASSHLQSCLGAPSENDGELPLVEPYDLTKNPFRMKGKYVVLDMNHMPMLGYRNS
jgi:hypothetical protein